MGKTPVETTRGRSTVTVAVLVLAMCMSVPSAATCAQSPPSSDPARFLVCLESEPAGVIAAGDSLVPRSDWKPWNPVTLIVQPVFGTAFGFLGLSAGFISAMAITGCTFGGCRGPQSTTTDALAIASWAGLTTLGLATGVSLAGDIAGADGNFGMTMVGSAAGIGLGVGLIAALPPEADPARGIAAYLVMIASPIVVYNLTAEAESLPPPPDPNVPGGMPEYLRPYRGESHSGLAPGWHRSLRPTGAGEDWREFTLNIPLTAVLGEH